MEDRYNVECCDFIHAHEDIVQRVQKSIPSEDTLYDLAELFRIFGDSTRIRILYVLFESEMCVCDIAQLLGMTQSAISHQLRALKNARLIKSRRDGKTVFYSLADSHVRTIIDQGRDHISEGGESHD
jgi:DNA-binding transcriptional ArsR family regulator